MDSNSAFDRLVKLGVARGGAVAIALVVLMALDTGPQRWLREQLFDGYQQLLPRQRLSAPAMIVEIDEASLTRYGQWPWPRSRLAELIDRIAAAGPAVIGVDIFMPEPDQLSPRRVIERVRGIEPALARRIAALPDNDALLAAALKGRPVVLGIAGDDGAAAPGERQPLRTAPVLLRGELGGLLQIPQYAGVVRNRPELEAAATGQGLINPAPEGGVIRRVGLLGRIGDLIVPNLEVEMLRVATGQRVLQGQVGSEGVEQVRIGELVIPTDRDGGVWLRYGERVGGRQVSAAEVLSGRADPALFARKLVLVGVTGLGLVDQPLTPLGQRIPGVEIRAQLLENIFDRSWLARPEGAAWGEAALFLLLSLAYIAGVPRGTPGQAFAGFAGVTGTVVIGGLVLFNLGWLIDVATPLAGAALVFTAVLGTTLAESQRQRRLLSRRLQAEREEGARLAGELETARRVQVGMLPESPGILAGDPRIDLKAFMEPARSVGGDLYDFFLLDSRTLVVMIGDVSGKGLAAAMFMALIKSLCKSAVLRQPRALDQALAEAEAEIRRENPESLFVTLLVLRLDLDTGEFTFCNAGHDPLYSLLPGPGAPRRIDHGGRPPLCVLEGYPYPLGREWLVPGERLCMITDGITEAMNPAGQLYGHKRLEVVLGRSNTADPAGIVDAVREDVREFVGTAEQADDMSVLSLRWNGPVRAPGGAA
jgi:adenylate cyclase